MTYSTHSSEENIKIMSSHLVKRLNSPLNSIKNIYHKLTTSSSIEYLKNLKTPLIFEIEHINKTISDSDSYSKAIKLNLENSNINSLIADIEDKINEIYNGYDIHISKILVSTQMISLDPVKFKQVLMNLFVNAIESMQDNKLNIIIKSQQDEHSLSIHFLLSHLLKLNALPK